MNSSRISALEKLACSLAAGASMELYLTPKPGLVDLADSGSHPDLSVSIMERSIRYVSGYLNEIVVSLVKGEPFRCQKSLGIKAEQRLLESLGTNTHKGYIFLSGMLLIAYWHSASHDDLSVRATLSRLAEDFFRTTPEQSTHGERARKKFNAGGIVLESINGFPSLFDEALPAYRNALKRHGCRNKASFAMLARLMQTVEDTTTLYRAGRSGLSRVQEDGRRLEQIIASGDNCLPHLVELNQLYIEMNITIGGVADMLGLAYGYLLARDEITAITGNEMAISDACGSGIY